MRISDWSSDVCSSDLYNKTHALRLAQMLKCRSVPRILKGHGRVVPFGQDECDGSSRITERTRHVLGQRAFETATLRSFQSLPYIRDIDQAGQQFPQFAGSARSAKRSVGQESVSLGNYRWKP